MKKISFFALAFTLVFTTSCKSDKKETKTETPTENVEEKTVTEPSENSGKQVAQCFL